MGFAGLPLRGFSVWENAADDEFDHLVGEFFCDGLAGEEEPDP
jgi:hypothetical protein